ncbi:hypothetical protein EON65_12060 [archaeon]|nr:MAG: hypothetical protein EON65_12060 [archaeon]
MLDIHYVVWFREASCNRKDLLEHCILVVSQCDKLVEDSYEELRNVLEKRGEQFKKYQFR